MQYAIQTHHLSKIFNAKQPNEVRAVSNVHLEVLRGNCILLKGSSGSGKTTLLTILACLGRATEGDYFCLGEHVSHWSEKFLTVFRQQHIGVIFQRFHLIHGLTVSQNIAVPLIPQRFSLAQIDKKVEHIAKEVGISHRLGFKVDTLSGGEMQRVAIARALVSNPELLFADEPTSSLDSTNSKHILELFKQFKAEGKTLILTSHDPLVEASNLADAVYEMKDGQLFRCS